MAHYFQPFHHIVGTVHVVQVRLCCGLATIEQMNCFLVFVIGTENCQTSELTSYDILLLEDRVWNMKSGYCDVNVVELRVVGIAAKDRLGAEAAFGVWAEQLQPAAKFKICQNASPA